MRWASWRASGQGVGAIAGNYLIIAQRDKDVFVALVHLRPAPFASPSART
jgi:hypothetical protein